MAASEAAVTAVMEALGCVAGKHRHHVSWITYGGNAQEVLHEPTDRGCPVAVAAADAAVDADRASIQAKALREAAAIGSLRFAATHTGRGARGWNVVEAKWLRARASEIEAQP